MSARKCAVVLAASAALVFLSARMASCDDGPAKTAPGASDKLAWDEPLDGLRMAGHPQLADDFPPPGPPRGSDRDLPPPRDRRGEADRQPGPGGPPDGDRGGPPPRDRQGRDARPGEDRSQPPPPPPPRDREGRLGQSQHDSPLRLEELAPQNDVEMYKLNKADMELNRQTHELAMQCRQASKEQTAELKKQLQELVNKQFEVRQERRNLELKRLDAEIQRLREAIDRRSKAKDKIVDQRVSDLLGVEGELSF